MNSRVDILDIEFDKLSLSEAIDTIHSYMNEEVMCRMVFTANPEFVIEAEKNKEFKYILNQADIVVADGIGIVKAAKMLGTPLKGRVAGYDLVQGLFEKMQHSNKSVYFLGTKEEIVKEAIEKMSCEYPELKIVGYRNGYFTKKDEANIVEEINKLQPDLLLIGLGAPKQEFFIYKYKEQLQVKVAIGVGGSIDGMSGRVKRAPQIFIKLNLEWFYRLIKQPSRIKRMSAIPFFLLKVLKRKISQK